MKKIIITLFILIFGLPSFAGWSKPYRYFFNPSYYSEFTADIQKGMIDHVEIYEDGTGLYYLLIKHNDPQVRYIIIPYGPYKEEAYKAYKENNELIYQDKNLFKKLIHKINKNKWDKSY